MKFLDRRTTMVTDKQIAKQLNFSCFSRLLRALNNMYVEGISLGYVEMEILSGLRTFACEGRSNCGVMFGSGGDECAAFASLESV